MLNAPHWRRLFAWITRLRAHLAVSVALVACSICAVALGVWLASDVLAEVAAMRGLPCDARASAERADEWARVRSMSEIAVVDEERCPGRADLAIYYSTVRDRDRIVGSIGPSFYGVPYRLFNV